MKFELLFQFYLILKPIKTLFLSITRLYKIDFFMFCFTLVFKSGTNAKQVAQRSLQLEDLCFSLSSLQLMKTIFSFPLFFSNFLALNWERLNNLSKEFLFSTKQMVRFWRALPIGNRYSCLGTVSKESKISFHVKFIWNERKN